MFNNIESTFSLHKGQLYAPGSLPGISSGGGKIYCNANLFCYANYSIVFVLNFGGGTASGGEGAAPLWKKASALIDQL